MPASRTPDQVHDDVNAAFLAHWTGAGQAADVIAWDEDDFDTTRQGLNEFVRFGFQHNDGTISGITGGTSQPLRRFGIISAVVYSRKGRPRVFRDQLTEVVMAFLEETPFAVGYVSVEDPGFDQIGLFDGWNQVNCTAQARYDLTRTA